MKLGVLFLAATGCMAQSSTAVPYLGSTNQSVSKAVRDARASLFDTQPRNRLEANPVDAPPLVTSIDPAPIPELPFRESDVVVRGRLGPGEPHLSFSRSSIYTEYVVAVDEVLKPTAFRADQITLIQRGGTGRLPSGRVLVDKVIGESELLENSANVLFLEAHPSCDCYTLLKSWRLEGDVAVPTHPYDIARAKSGASALAGMDLSTFGSTLRTAAKAAPQR